MHSLANTGIALCYGSISALLVYIYRDERARRLTSIWAYLFPAFASCGVGHGLEAILSPASDHWHSITLAFSLIPAIGGWIVVSPFLESLETFESVTKLQRIVEAVATTASVPLAVLQLQGDTLMVLWHNMACLEFAATLGDTQGKSSLVGCNWYEIFPIGPKWREDHRRAAAGERLSSPAEYWPSGDVWIAWEIEPVVGLSGGLFFQFQVVTDYLREMEKLKTLNESLRSAIFQALPGNPDV